MEVPAKAAAVALPVLRKNRVLPPTSPMKRSKSPSPSMSAKAGLALLLAPMELMPKGLLLLSAA